MYWEFKENTKEVVKTLKLDKVLHYIKLLLVALFIVFEELAWNRIGEPAYNAIKSLQIMEKFKNWVADINHRYLLLLIFMIPFVLMEGASLAAFKAWGSGLLFTGIGLYSMKLLLTAPVVIIFNTGKKTLVSFWLIKYIYGMILNMKKSDIFRSVKRWGRKFKAELAVFKHDYLDSHNGSFSASFKELYRALKSN